MRSRFISLLMILVAATFSCESSLTPDQLLDKSIQYHDPDDEWVSFKGNLNITMTTPDRSDRNTEILIDLPAEHFYSKAVRDSLITEYDVLKNDCSIRFNGRSEFTDKEISDHGLTCDRAKMYKNYYTYLYGLPMKLKDPGTHLSDSVEQEMFQGKDYLVIKVTYDEHVGRDIWFFYFDPETYAMEIYQFFRKDDSGKLNRESGEYILLTEEVLVNNIRMPKVRAWYYNKDDEYLGTDTLN